MGDPAGIGPEVIAKSLARSSFKNSGYFVIIGDYSIYRRYNTKLQKNVSFVDLKNAPSKDVRCGISNSHGARASLEYIDVALSLLKGKNIQAMVTAPVSKEAISSLGCHFQGHTEYIAKYFKVKKFGMLFVADDLKAMVATRHIPLSEVSSKLTTKCIEDAINLTVQALRKFFRIKKPVIAVCGLNPHAGEQGRIGKEEITKIIPAIKRAQRKNVRVLGPFPADTLFFQKIASQYDAIIAMYHDQGLIGLKTLHFNQLVNMTVGLPFIRTSPAHGTAFNIAGKNKADPSSMSAAIKLAATLSR